MGNTICTLTLQPYYPLGVPAFTHDINLKTFDRIGLQPLFSIHPVQNGISLDNNLGNIEYLGGCLGTKVQIYPDPIFQGEPFEVTLPEESGILKLPCSVVKKASSIKASLPSIIPSGSRLLREVDLQLYYDEGLLTDEAFDRLKQEDPQLIRETVEKLEQDHEAIEELESQIPLTLEQILKLLKEDAN